MSPEPSSSASWTTGKVLDVIPTHLRLDGWHAFVAAVAGVAMWILLRFLQTCHRKPRTTQLRGPPSDSFLYGAGKRVLDTDDQGTVYETWAQEYGLAYAAPSALGSKKVILCDPKAVAHFLSKGTWTYVHSALGKEILAHALGKGLLWADGEDHKRQRKSLTPAFSIPAIRQLTSIFYDSAYKAKGAWDLLIESNGGNNAVIEVQNWMNHISLDTIGLAGFSHNFGALEGKRAGVTEVFDAFSASSASAAVNTGLLLLGEVFPFLIRIPTARTKSIEKLGAAMEEISNALLEKTKKELEMGVIAGKEERSVIGLLIKGANDNSEFRLTKEEVMSQMKVVLVAGYETTAISLTWALLELSRNPEVQTKLRNELLEHGADPTYDQLSNDLPYLDAVAHEILRIHSPVSEVTRVAFEDDVVPLSEPIRTKSGELVDSLTIAKGTRVTVPMDCMNRSSAFWGEDAKAFRPSRWLEDIHGQNGIPAKAKEIHGHRHLLTFIDGPRTCLGKHFALAEFKAVLTILVKNFVFELRDGTDYKIEMVDGLLRRPKLAGEVGCGLPLRVRPYVA